jgi:diguanylate cyclase (GGDEF)-like protein/PAS domain S-box-containing protein
MTNKGTETKDLLDELKGNASMWKSLLEESPIGILLIDRDYRIRYLNPVLAGWLRRPAEEVLGKKCHVSLFGSEQPCKEGPETCPATAVLSSTEVSGPATFGRQGQGGEKKYFRIDAQPVPDDSGTPLYAVSFILDVTAEKLLKDCREDAVLRDPVTGLYNRQGFNLLLGRERKRTRRQGHPLSMCLIDIDSFKDYNEKKGEEAGDRLLEQFADILVSQTRVDVDSLARLQADTFALILPEASHEQALRIGLRVRGAVEKAAPEMSFSMAVRESDNAEDEDTFYHRTMDVLFQAKKAGGNQTL